MRKCIAILFLLSSLNGFCQPADSLNLSEKDLSVLDEVIHSDKAPDTGKVEYINQLTRYGFKNLFAKNLHYPGISPSGILVPQAESFIRDYLAKHTNHLRALRKWGQHYFNFIDQILVMYGLPKELKYLAVIESNLQTSATSHAGATGPWQFMPGTARDYGLRVNAQMDERRDYLKSTHAAAKYLLTLYKEFKDWLLVIAAYNGGPGKVYNAIRKSGSRNFWVLQHYLPEESRNHVKKFIATHFVMEILQDDGENVPHMQFQPWSNVPLPGNNASKLTEDELNNAKKMTISGKYNSKIIAQHLEMELKEFLRYNPSFDDHLETLGQYDLQLPADKMDYFQAHRYDILNACVQYLLQPTEPPATRTVYPKKKTTRP